MSDGLSYAILGRGVWARRMQAILQDVGRRVVYIERARREPRESDAAYEERITFALLESRTNIAWLCVPPGPHVESMAKAAILARMHAVAEKPWRCSRATTETLEASARGRGVQLGVHFQYCFLNEIEKCRERYYQESGLRFSGRFTVSRPNRLGIPAIENLGSHLLAMRRYAAPESHIEELLCAYDCIDERHVWIADESINFLKNREPIVQRFIRSFEAAIDGAQFPFGLSFAFRVAEDVTRWRGRQTAESRPL